MVSGFTVNHEDIDEFTELVLKFFRTHTSELPNFSKAARIIFAFSANSACVERVFSMMKEMFGDKQVSALADLLQASLMLRYNKRL